MQKCRRLMAASLSLFLFCPWRVGKSSLGTVRRYFLTVSKIFLNKKQIILARAFGEAMSELVWPFGVLLSAG